MSLFVKYVKEQADLKTFVRTEKKSNVQQFGLIKLIKKKILNRKMLETLYSMQEMFRMRLNCRALFFVILLLNSINPRHVQIVRNFGSELIQV